MNPENHTPTHEYFCHLLERIGKSQRWIAERTGIHKKRLERLKTGKYFITYPEQYILEQLAEIMTVSRHK